MNKVYFGDWIDVLRTIPDGTVDLFLSDIPYGVTQAKWDFEVPIETFWAETSRVLTDDGVTVVTCVQPYSSRLIQSNVKGFTQELIWAKNRASGFLNANRRHMPIHENILVFGRYFSPVLTAGATAYKTKNYALSDLYGARTQVTTDNHGTRSPKTVLTYSRPSKAVHPTQKPVDLFRYLIETYCPAGGHVVDPFAGSGTTALAGVMGNRRVTVGDNGYKSDRYSWARYIQARLERYKYEIELLEV